MNDTIRDRIQEFRRVAARELLDHDGNRRRHPQAQRDALLQEVRAKAPAVVAMLKDLAKNSDAGRAEKSPAVALPPERFEIVVECQDEQHQREIYDQLTGEGLKCRVLTF